MPPHSSHTVDNSPQEVLIVFGVFLAVLLISKFIFIQISKSNNPSENQKDKLSLYALALLNGNIKHGLRTLFVKLLKKEYLLQDESKNNLTFNKEKDISSLQENERIIVRNFTTKTGVKKVTDNYSQKKLKELFGKEFFELAKKGLIINQSNKDNALIIKAGSIAIYICTLYYYFPFLSISYSHVFAILGTFLLHKFLILPYRTEKGEKEFKRLVNIHKQDKELALARKYALYGTPILVFTPYNFLSNKDYEPLKWSQINRYGNFNIKNGVDNDDGQSSSPIDSVNDFTYLDYLDGDCSSGCGEACGGSCGASCGDDGCGSCSGGADGCGGCGG